MARYSYIPPEYKTNTNNMSTTTHPTTAAGTQLNYNDAAKNRALDYSAQPTSKSMSNLPLYWSSPSPWELEVAMAAAKAKAKPKRKPKPLLFASQSPWEYEVAILVSEPKPIPKPKPKPVPEPKPKTKPYTSKFREVGTDDLTEPCKADYRAKVELDYRFEFESEQKKGGKMAQAVKDLYKGFQAGAGKK